MKILKNDDELLIYLNNFYIKNVDFKDADFIEDYMNDLFQKLKDTYKIKLSGFYNIDIYVDINYGIIITAKKEEIEYYDYFIDQIDTQITIHNNINFLYKINDIFEIKKYLNCNYSIYKYDNELYLKLNDKLDENNFFNILEYSKEICYDIEQIIKSKNLLFCNK